MLFTADELDSIPLSGSAWTTFATASSTSLGTIDMSDQNSFTAAHVLLQAIRWAIDGGGVGDTSIINNLKLWPATAGGDALGIYRQMAAIVCAADLVDMPKSTVITDYGVPLGGTGTTMTWEAWLLAMVEREIDDHPRYLSIRSTSAGYSGAESTYSNYGAYARSAYMAIAYYVGDSTQQDEAVASLRQFMGTDQGLTGFLETAAFSTPFYGQSWVDGGSFPNSTGNRFGINPADAGIDLAGVIYEDAARGGPAPEFGSGPVPPTDDDVRDGVSYSCECLEGNLAAAMIAFHCGHTDIFHEADDAFLRVLYRLAIDGNINDTSFAQYANYRELPHLINQIYGSSHPEVTPTSPLRFIRNGDALTASPSTWLMEVLGPPSAIDDLTTIAGNEMVALSWTPPAENGAEITEYIIQYRFADPPPSAFSDNFNRADATGLGASWQQGSSPVFNINTNQAQHAAAFGGFARWGFDCDTLVQFSEFTYAATASGTSLFVGPSIMMAPHNSGGGTVAQGEWFTFFVSGTSMNALTIRRKENLSTTVTTLASATFTVVVGDVMRLESDGTDLIGYINGVERIRHAGFTALSNGGMGVGFQSGTANTAIRIDDWSGGDF
jgi:hypothetical protein